MRHSNGVYCIVLAHSGSFLRATGMKNLGGHTSMRKLDKNVKIDIVIQSPFQNIWGNVAITESG